MKHLLSVLIAVFAVLVFFVSCGGTESAYSEIVGHVIDADTGDALDNASVTLSPSGKSIFTGSDGYFEFHDLDAMSYSVTAQKQGYKTNRKNVQTIAGEVVNITIMLLKEE